MTIRKLKELIKDLPDDMRICADDGSRGMFSDNNEYLTLVVEKDNTEMCILQTREDFETAEELDAWYKWVVENNINEQDFWVEFAERGYIPADFYNEEKEAWADKNLRHYGIQRRDRV